MTNDTKKIGELLKGGKKSGMVPSDEPSERVIRLRDKFPIPNHRAGAVGEVKIEDMPEGEESAYRRLREARSEARLVGRREKRAKAKAEESAAQKK